jgi:hypothetical protein
MRGGLARLRGDLPLRVGKILIMGAGLEVGRGRAIGKPLRRGGLAYSSKDLPVRVGKILIMGVGVWRIMQGGRSGGWKRVCYRATVEAWRVGVFIKRPAPTRWENINRGGQVWRLEEGVLSGNR